MRKTSFDLSLRVDHPELSKERVIFLIGLEPGRAWTVGHQRTNPKGLVLQGTYEQTYCTFKLKTDGFDSLVGCMRFHAKQLKKQRLAQISEITASGGTLEFFVGWYIRKSGGETLDVALLSLLSELKIEVGLDVYEAGAEP